MRKYIIKVADGYFIERFFKTSIVVTQFEISAGRYTKSIANKRLSKLNIEGELILKP